LTLPVVFCLSILFGKAPAAERDYPNKVNPYQPFRPRGGIDISFQPSIERLGLEIN
jgi:hypothetical protein